MVNLGRPRRPSYRLGRRLKSSAKARLDYITYLQTADKDKGIKYAPGQLSRMRFDLGGLIRANIAPVRKARAIMELGGEMLARLVIPRSLKGAIAYGGNVTIKPVVLRLLKGDIDGGFEMRTAVYPPHRLSFVVDYGGEVKARALITHNLKPKFDLGGEIKANLPQPALQLKAAISYGGELEADTVKLWKLKGAIEPGGELKINVNHKNVQVIQGQIAGGGALTVKTRPAVLLRAVVSAGGAVRTNIGQVPTRLRAVMDQGGDLISRLSVAKHGAWSLASSANTPGNKTTSFRGIAVGTLNSLNKPYVAVGNGVTDTANDRRAMRSLNGGLSLAALGWYQETNYAMYDITYDPTKGRYIVVSFNTPTTLYALGSNDAQDGVAAGNLPIGGGSGVHCGGNGTSIATWTGSNTGLGRSLDGGASWSSRSVTTGLTNLGKPFRREDNGTWIIPAQGGIFRSINDGAGWTQIPISDAGLIKRCVYGNGIWLMVIASGNDRIRYSTDDGLTWTPVPNLPVEIQNMALADVAFLNGVFAAVASSGGATSQRRVITSLNPTVGAGWTVRSITGTSNAEWVAIVGNPAQQNFMAVAASATTGQMRTIYSS